LWFKERISQQKDLIAQSVKQNDGQDFPQSMLEELFANIVTVELSFEGAVGGYQGERRHGMCCICVVLYCVVFCVVLLHYRVFIVFSLAGWVLHKTVTDKNWKKHWALLTEKGGLYLLPGSMINVY
jgi:hypothetical protein